MYVYNKVQSFKYIDIIKRENLYAFQTNRVINVYILYVLFT